MVKQVQVVYYSWTDQIACFYNAIANFLSLLQLIGGLNMEDNVKNYKNLQNSLFHNACHLAGVKGIGVHFL